MSDLVKTIRKKLVVVGDGACGKTCLLVTFSSNQFPTEYIPTVFETCLSYITVDDKHVELGLWDTAGQEEYDVLRPLSYNNTDVVLIIFALDSRDSFENVLSKWSGEVKHYCVYVPVVLVGTKKDLRDGNDKCIRHDEGVELATQIGAVDYIECSALKREGLRDVFECATRHALKKRRRKHAKCVLT